MTKNIQTSVSATGIVVTNKATGSKVVIELGEKNKLVGRVEATDAKDKQYGSYINKFVREVVGKHMGKKVSYKDRLKKIGTAIESLNNSGSFRQLSNRLRKSLDNGKMYPVGTFFYEGKRNEPATK